VNLTDVCIEVGGGMAGVGEKTVRRLSGAGLEIADILLANANEG